MNNTEIRIVSQGYEIVIPMNLWVPDIQEALDLGGLQEAVKCIGYKAYHGLWADVEVYVSCPELDISDEPVDMTMV